MTESEKPDPKIIIDEDYKSQVAAEKEALKQREQQQGGSAEANSHDSSTSAEGATQSAGTEQSETSAAGRGADSPEQNAHKLPPASFSSLVTSLATQALAAMGQLPDPDGNRMPIEKDAAQFMIDTLSVLEDKTRGNLTEAEAGMLKNILHELRMLFVTLGK